jgi:hypothetical protein
MKKYIKLGTVFVVSSTLVLSGCATTGASMGQENADSSGECNAVGAAVIGGILGAIVSGKNDRGAGAAIGATLAGLACMAINFQSQQTASADQVKKQYQTQNKALPKQATVTQYRAASPSNVRKGDALKIQTSATVLEADSGSKPNLSETIELSPPNNQKGPKSTKVLSKAGGGSFTQSYTVPISKELPSGVWGYKSTLFVDGKEQKVTTGKFTVI